MAEEAPTQETTTQNQEECAAEKKDETSTLSWPMICLCIFVSLACLYLFLIGLSLMGSSFKVLGGKSASSIFSAVDNPIAGLMVGILATVLVQSSSTSTSIVVTMVAEGALDVRQGIPIIMGANIGTSVTNTIVSMGQMMDRDQLQRSFAGATVHDAFNFLSVLVLLPLEIIIGAIQGEGGILYWISYGITQGLMGGEGGDELFTSPIKTITGPIANEFLKANKYVIYALTLTAPVALTPMTVNETVCQPLNATRRLSLEAENDLVPDSRALLNRRLSGLEDCSQYYCVSSALDGQFKKISKSSYKKLTGCKGMILDDIDQICGDSKCYLDAGAYWEDKVANAPVTKGGFLGELTEPASGIVGLIISIIMLCIGLIGLTKSLQKIFIGNAQRFLRYATQLNDYVAIVIGIGVTIIVQSSSIVTSALTPLCGLGVLPLEKMLPLTLGANIGTTLTAMIASLVSLKFGAVQIALCHLWFNIFGIVIWFPIPVMRKVPLGMARLLGLYASHVRVVPVIYICVAFILVPGLCVGVSALFKASVAGGVVVLLILLASVAVFEYMWIIGYPKGRPLCYRVLPKEMRGNDTQENEPSVKSEVPEDQVETSA